MRIPSCPYSRYVIELDLALSAQSRRYGVTVQETYVTRWSGITGRSGRRRQGASLRNQA